MKKIKQVLLITILVFVFGIIFFVYDVRVNKSQTMANFADNVVRPLIGNNATIKLEAILFNFEDQVNQVTYRIKSNNQTQPIDTSTLIWKDVIEDKADGSPILQTSLFYPDPARPYAIVHLVRINMKKIKIGSVAGTKEPASLVGHPGTGIIPQDVVGTGSLIAAFNGGFQYRDGQYGMIVGGQVYLPLREGLATLLIDKNSNVSIVEDNGQINISDYIAIRQNGEMLIRDGLVVPQSQDKSAAVWGRSVTNNMYTWRSGLGVDANGDLIYAVGPSLIPLALGRALKAGGAQNAMQLDINPFWVRFSVFSFSGAGYNHQSLFAQMYDGGKEFLIGDKKDFFYLYLRSNLNPANLNYLLSNLRIRKAG